MAEARRTKCGWRASNWPRYWYWPQSFRVVFVCVGVRLLNFLSRFLNAFLLSQAMAQADGVLDAPQLMKFKRVVREGPFASNAEPGVAVGAEDA